MNKRFLADQDSIREVLGRQWRQALLLTTGRIGFDFGCLLGALRATGAHPQPSPALPAYAAVGIVALIPSHLAALASKKPALPACSF
jgi:uncharacterized membrane protein YbhN (UPF0104 family)